jgi:uroporphyrinogen-III synthase
VNDVLRVEAPPGPLTGFRIALLEARLASEVAALVRRLGGEALSAPALRERPVAAPAVAGFLEALRAGEIGFVVLQTGVSVGLLFAAAAELGREEELRQALGRVSLVCRGPKPLAALAARRLRASVHVDSPHTSAELAHALARLPLQGAGVALVHHGERNEPLASMIREAGARLHELLLYEWQLPEDLQPLLGLVDAILAGGIDVVVFTTQVQVRHLFEVAGREQEQPLAAALRALVVGAVGPTCAEALRRRGVPDVVVPDNPKLGPLFAALASRLARRRAAAGEAPRGDRP